MGISQSTFGGWQSWLNLPNANDASVALVAVVSMFLIPNGKGEKLLDWSTASDIPWGMLYFLVAELRSRIFVSSGLSVWVRPIIGLYLKLAPVFTYLRSLSINYLPNRDD